MANKGTTLTTNQYLSTNDYLLSSNDVFVALMQSDGNLVVYRGQDAIGKTPTQEQGSLWSSGSSGAGGQFVTLMQSDGNFVIYPGQAAIGKTPGQEQGALWSSGSSGPGGQFFVVLQDDGNLVVQAGTPSTPGAVLWKSGPTDPVVGCDTITDIHYDLKHHGPIQNKPPATLTTVSGHNTTSKEIPFSVDQSVSVTLTSGWSDALGIQLGAKATYKAKIPLIAEGDVELSASITNTFTWNGSTSTTETLDVTAGPVALQPNETITATILGTTSSVSMPYTLYGILALQSGAKIPGKIQGTYTGVNTSNCTVEFTQGSPNAQRMRMPASISGRQS